MRRVRVALAAALIAMAAALGVVLSGSPLSVAGTNGIPARLALSFIHRGRLICQLGGTLPAGTTSIRVSLSANVGPHIELRVLSGSTLVTEGQQAAGWGVDETVTVPVARVARTIDAARICITVGAPAEGVQVNGLRTRSISGRRLILLRFEYLRPSPHAWLSLATAIAGHMGVVRAAGGAWVAYVALAAMIAAAAVASRLVLRELR
jgi:hypothetical protein